MAELSKQQIDAAVMAMQEAERVSIFWEHVCASDKERFRKAARAAAPYLQLPWDEPLMGEITTIYDSMLHGEANTFAVVRAFVRHRNAALQPKPVDPAVEVVSRMLRGRSLDTSFDDYAAKLVEAVRAIPPAKHQP